MKKLLIIALLILASSSLFAAYEVYPGDDRIREVVFTGELEDGTACSVRKVYDEEFLPCTYDFIIGEHEFSYSNLSKTLSEVPTEMTAIYDKIDGEYSEQIGAIIVPLGLYYEGRVKIDVEDDEIVGFDFRKRTRFAIGFFSPPTIGTNYKCR